VFIVIVSIVVVHVNKNSKGASVKNKESVHTKTQRDDEVVYVLLLCKYYCILTQFIYRLQTEEDRGQF
jgi:hypothetical protein